MTDIKSEQTMKAFERRRIQIEGGIVLRLISIDSVIEIKGNMKTMCKKMSMVR